MLVFTSLLPPHWLSSIFSTSKDKELRESILLKHSKKVHKGTESILSSNNSMGSDEKSAKYGLPSSTGGAKVSPLLEENDVDFNKAVSSLRSSAVDKICQAEELPMLVVPLKSFLEFGKVRAGKRAAKEEVFVEAS